MSMLNVSETEYQKWLDCYIKNDYNDPHEMFAGELGLERCEAKALCYKIMYSSTFIVKHFENIKDGERT